MTQSQPSITGTTHTLPFDKLSPRDFERLCLWLVEREGYERAEHLGAAGSEGGRDIVAWREGALWAFQCKRVRRFGPKAALTEVEKVLALLKAERPAALVFLVTCDVSARTRQQARARCAEEMECHFWASTELDEKVKRHPNIFEEFFHSGITQVAGDLVQGDKVEGDKIVYAAPPAPTKRSMSSNLVNILLNIIAAVILTALAYLLTFLFPNMHAELRMLVSGLAAIVVLLILHVISRIAGRSTHWLGRIGARLSNGAKMMFESVKARINRLRACLRGELEQCHSELKAEREKYQEERAKVNKLTLRLATLSQPVLGLFDERMEKPDGLEWDGALAASERATRFARAALDHHVTKVVYYDPNYPASWMGGENAEKTRDYFVDRWFVEKNAQQLRNWIHKVLKSGLAYRSLIVFAQDIVPDTVAEVANETCLLRKYLNAGGRVVWRGDIPFWYQGKAGGAKEKWLRDGPRGVLDVLYHNYVLQGGGRIWNSDLPPEVTPTGRSIGLDYSGKCTRSVPCEDVDLTYVLIRQETFTIAGVIEHGSGGDFALCWKKNFNRRYPHSGFMQYVLGTFLWRDDTTANFFRFAISGWPLMLD